MCLARGKNLFNKFINDYPSFNLDKPVFLALLGTLIKDQHVIKRQGECYMHPSSKNFYGYAYIESSNIDKTKNLTRKENILRIIPIIISIIATISAVSFARSNYKITKLNYDLNISNTKKDKEIMQLNSIIDSITPILKLKEIEEN